LASKALAGAATPATPARTENASSADTSVLMIVSPLWKQLAQPFAGQFGIWSLLRAREGALTQP